MNEWVIKHVLHADGRKAERMKSSRRARYHGLDTSMTMGLSGVTTDEVALGLRIGTVLVDLEVLDSPVGILVCLRVVGDVVYA